MNRRIIALMTAGLGLCLTLTAWLAWSNWQLQQQIESLGIAKHAPQPEPAPDWLDRLAPSNTPVTSPLAPSSPATGWDPFAEMDRMQQQIDRWMQGAPFGFSQMPRGNFLGAAAAQPDIRIEEDSDVYRVRVAVPEGSELELSTEVDEKRLTVSGAVSTNLDESNRRFFSSSQFSRQFTLNSPVDSLGMRKEARDNEIIITLPKA